MSKVKCVVSVCAPGGFAAKTRSLELSELESILKGHQIQTFTVDSVAGWFNLDQDWLEFEDEVETSWGPCRPTCLTDVEWDWFYDVLCKGSLVMMIHYLNEDGTVEAHQ